MPDEALQAGENLVQVLYNVVNLPPPRLGDITGDARFPSPLEAAVSRSLGAFELLRGFHDRSVGDDRELARTAIGLLRSEEAQAFLEA